MRQRSVVGVGHQSFGAAVVEGSAVEALVTLLVAMPPLRQLRVTGAPLLPAQNLRHLALRTSSPFQSSS